MADGYNAQILWVDLTEGRTEVREPGEEVMRKYIGGAGLAALVADDLRALGRRRAQRYAP